MPKPKPIADLLDFVVTHSHGGNGWIVVQDEGDGYVRVAPLMKMSIGRRAYLAWTGCLSIEKQPDDPKDPQKKLLDYRIPTEVTAELGMLRGDLASGRKVVKNTRIVDK